MQFHSCFELYTSCITGITHLLMFLSKCSICRALMACIMLCLFKTLKEAKMYIIPLMNDTKILSTMRAQWTPFFVYRADSVYVNQLNTSFPQSWIYRTFKKNTRTLRYFYSLWCLFIVYLIIIRYLTLLDDLLSV